MNFKVIVFCASYLILIEACKIHKTCKDCITDPNLCDWCTSTDQKYDKEPRCRARGSFEASWCSGELDQPENASVTPKTNANFSSGLDDVVQIKPQKYNVKLRPGQPLTFEFSFQKAKDYPVDLYVLLDASTTMASIKKNLADHSENLYRKMQNMTKNVFMGFGTFVDKNTMPYAHVSKKAAKQAYSFRNILNLTNDYIEFKKMMTLTKFGSNYDIPEGGFDALAQVMACDVKWRKNSRRVIVFLTDSPQHVAGDGRTSGIFQPYDRKCHTNAEGVYTKELELDYPSLVDINVLAASKTTIIFTLTGSDTHFDGLQEIIKGSRVTALTGENDIVSVLEEIYKEISTNIKLEVEVKSGHRNNYDIKFDPDCHLMGDESCTKVESGQRRDFRGTITLKEYYGIDKEEIDISVQGIDERLTLGIDVIQCPCAVDEQRSPHCFGENLQCGTCICGSTTYGNRCMCKKGEMKTNNQLCIPPNADTTLDAKDKMCSGEGECECGLCKCNDGRIGQFCECHLRSCPGYGSRAVCGGHGSCTCSGASDSKTVCKCDSGWSLKPGAEYLGCVCEDATDLCIDKKKSICNNRGNCTCNSCICEPIPDWDKRIEQDSFCNIQPCPTCHSLQCSIVRDCVHCRLNSEHCYSECTGIFLHGKIYDVLPSNLSSEWNLCKNEKLDSGCYTKFAYRYDDKVHRILLVMQKDADCAENYYKFGGIILGSVLLVGILTLLAWKCLTRYQDMKEYKKFESQHKEDLNAPSINPLYDEPRTFRNPAFKKSFS